MGWSGDQKHALDELAKKMPFTTDREKELARMAFNSQMREYIAQCEDDIDPKHQELIDALGMNDYF